MTYADLKAALDRMTPEQLAMDVVWSGDECGGKVDSLWIAEEDWVENDGDCEPRSVIPPAEAKTAAVLIPRGAPQLLLDDWYRRDEVNRAGKTSTFR